MKLEIDFVIETSLVAIFSKNLLSEQIYLKGGQALRIKEKLKNRFSADTDFSVGSSIGNSDVFFELMEAALTQEFYQNGYCLFDFKKKRQPKQKPIGAPDFWGGWAVEFKLTAESNRNLEPALRQRSALVPVGSPSPKITLDISEHEYLGSVEKVKVKGIDINVYSRALLLTEKIRAICQQHEDYPYRNGTPRARDYYDIERLWNIVISNDGAEAFLKECRIHLPKVFLAKGVSLDLLKKIFDADFANMQKNSWPSVENTVTGSISPFSYYEETLSRIINDIGPMTDE